MLPIPVLQLPHWRVNYRPSVFNEGLIASIGACQELVRSTKLSLRGWDFPHYDTRNGKSEVGKNWIGSSIEFGNHMEYWKLFQSGQFLHLQAVRESLDADWKTKLEGAARSHAHWRADVDWETVPGYFSLVNFIYTVTEVFEFAARIAQRGVYTGEVAISIGLHGVRGFVLTPELDRAWMDYRALSENTLEQTWTVESRALIAGSRDAAASALVWFFERFDWQSPNTDMIRRDQEKFLAGRW